MTRLLCAALLACACATVPSAPPSKLIIGASKATIYADRDSFVALMCNHQWGGAPTASWIFVTPDRPVSVLIWPWMTRCQVAAYDSAAKVWMGLTS